MDAVELAIDTPDLAFGTLTTQQQKIKHANLLCND